MGQTEVMVTQPALGHCPAWCSGTHNGCFCELFGLTLYIAIVMPLGDH